MAFSVWEKVCHSFSSKSNTILLYHKGEKPPDFSPAVMNPLEVGRQLLIV